MTKGTFDNWHGDEYECHGNCGSCERCEAALQSKIDDGIEQNLMECL